MAGSKIRVQQQTANPPMVQELDKKVEGEVGIISFFASLSGNRYPTSQTMA